MIVKGQRLIGSGRAVVMVTMTVDEALHVGMELGDDGRSIFDAAWDLLPDDAPERAELRRTRMTGATIGEIEYPPEVQAVLDAADAYIDHVGSLSRREQLTKAVTVLRETSAPPQPFERFMARYGIEWGAYQGTEPDYWHDVEDDAHIWRVQITPIERVR